MSSAPVFGWRLAQPRVTLLASAFYVEWTLPTYTPEAGGINKDNKAIFTPPGHTIMFTVEWKAASSLESTKLDFRGAAAPSSSSSSSQSAAAASAGDMDDAATQHRNCLIPIEWSDEDVVLRLSFRFVEPVALPDGTKASVATIFDGERCILRARRAEPMPLLRAALLEEEMRRARIPTGAAATAAQILKAHPALVDAFTLATARRANDTTLLEAGPWLGDRKALGLDQHEDHDDGAAEEEQRQAAQRSDPVRSRKYEGCAVLNGIKFDVWEVTYRRQKRCGGTRINFGFFGTPPGAHHPAAAAGNTAGSKAGAGGASPSSPGLDASPSPKQPFTHTAVSAHAAPPAVATTQQQQHQPPQKKAKPAKQSQRLSDTVANTAALMGDGAGVSPAMTATFSSSLAAAGGTTTNTTDDGEDSGAAAAAVPDEGQEEMFGSGLADGDDVEPEPLPQDDDDADDDDADQPAAAGDDGHHSAPEPSVPVSTGDNQKQGASPNDDDSDADDGSAANGDHDDDDHDDTVVFLAVHDGLDDVNMFENRKLTERLNPINILRAVFEEWLNRDNLVVVVTGSFTNGAHATSTAEHLIRFWDQQLARLQQQQTPHDPNTPSPSRRDPCGYTRPRILCVTFASNPPRLSVADASGRLRRKDVPVVRAQNHFLHVAPIIEAPVVAPDDIPIVEASANARRSRSLEFVDYFLGECASFAIAPDRTSIALESYLDRQNTYDIHSVLMTAPGSSAAADALNPVFAVANAAAAAANISTSHNSETASVAAFESPFMRAILDETASSSGFTPLDLAGNLPELTRERSLMAKGLPEHLQSALHAPSLLAAFEASLQLHLVAAAAAETIADAYPRCEPIITHAEIRPTKLRLAELTLWVEGSNLAFPRHVVLRDSAIGRDVVFPRTEVEVEIRGSGVTPIMNDKLRGGFDGFTCKVHPAALLRFLNYDATPRQTDSELAASAAARMLGGGGNVAAESAASRSRSGSQNNNSSTNHNANDDYGATLVANNSFRRGSPPRHTIKRLCAKFDVCVWADNGCAAFVDVVAPLPEAILPWMPGSGSWTSQQSAFVAPPIELITNAVRLHAWGSFSSSQAGAPCPGTDMPRRLLKAFEAASVAVATVAPADGGSNFFSRALRSAKRNLSTDPLTMSNAPVVPASLKLQTTDALLKDVPSATPGGAGGGGAQSQAAAAARTRLLLQSGNSNPKALRAYLEPLMSTLGWLQNGTDYAERVLRAAQVMSIPLQRGWFMHAHGSSAAAPASAAAASVLAASASSGGRGRANTNPVHYRQRSSQAATPVVEALLWHHVVTVLAAGGTRIQESVTEITLKSFVESIGHVAIKHEWYQGKKESDGEAFFVDLVAIYTVCLVHELRALSTGTTLVLCTGEGRAGVSSIAATVQAAAPAVRHPTLPLAFVWVVDVHPLPDVVADALALFPNVALLFVSTLDACCTTHDTDVMRLSSTTSNIIRAQRTQGDPNEETSFCRHQQWLVLNQIDNVEVPRPLLSDAAARAERELGGSNNNASVTGSSSAPPSPVRAAQLSASKQIDARVAFIREQFEANAAPALRSWQAGASLLCVATDPDPGARGAVSQPEVGELRVQALEVLQLAVRQIAVW